MPASPAVFGLVALCWTKPAQSYSATLGLRPELAKGRTGLRSHICLTPGTLAHNSQALLSLRIETFHPCEYSKRLVGPLVKGLICIGLWTKQPTGFILFPQRMQLRECGKQKPEAGSGEHLNTCHQMLWRGSGCRE